MAALINLGIAGMRPPAAAAPKAAPAEPKMIEMGTTGTGIFGQGYIRELGEYNDLFSGGPFSAILLTNRCGAAMRRWRRR